MLPTSLRIAFLVVAALLCSCSRTLSNVGSADGGAGDGGGGNGGGEGVIFSLEDLNGDWTGTLQGDAINESARNFYLRIVDGLITESAEGTGSEWDSATAQFSLRFDEVGRLQATLNSDFSSGRLSLEGQMDDAMVLISGTYTLALNSGGTTSGSFSVTRSTGPGHFSIALLDGEWTGEGVNSRSKFRLASIEIDANGVLQSAEVLHPVTGAAVHTYSVGAATFELVDDSVGRFRNVVLNSDDGSSLGFRYLLINEEGTLVSGPGSDTDLGNGYVLISR